MKTILKMVIALLLSILITFSSISVTCALSDEEQINVDNKYIEDSIVDTIDEEKINVEVSADENFSGNSIIVIMKNNVSLKFEDYDVDDFSEVNAISVENIAPYTYNAVKDKYEAILAKNIKVNDSGLLPTDISNVFKTSTQQKSSKSNLTSYLNKNNIISLLNRPLFDAKTKQAEFKIAVEEYINELEESHNFLKDYDYSDYHLQLKITLSTNNKQKVIEAINALKSRDDILCVMPNYCGKFDSVPNDEYVSQQWHLNKIGYFDALDYADNTKTVTVGILDSGINASHPDLHNNIDFELSKSFVDDDPFDDKYGHGTCVAGIIGASVNNATGVAGICPNVNLVSLKVGNDNVDNSVVVTALDYAEANNIGILNLSFDTPVFLQDGLNEAKKTYSHYSGIMVCSAGNNNIDIDNNGKLFFTPSVLDLENIISVAAIDKNNKLAVYDDNDPNYASNYGQTSVDLAAPGKSIYTTSADLTQRYRNFNGTSSAAPVVTGIAALIKSIHPDITVSQLKSFMLNNVNTVSSLKGKVATSGVVNVNNILLKINQKKFTVQYKPNGGSGEAMDDTTVYYGVNKELTHVSYTKLDYRFVGWTAHRKSDNKWIYKNQAGTTKWYTESSAPSNYTKATYNDRARVSKTSSVNNDIITMYAKWEKLSQGDVNMDGVISILDVTLIQKYIASLVTFSDQQKRLADVNGDGNISILDVTEIQRIIAS